VTPEWQNGAKWGRTACLKDKPERDQRALKSTAVFQNSNKVLREGRRPRDRFLAKMKGIAQGDGYVRYPPSWVARERSSCGDDGDLEGTFVRRDQGG
jgi:hypothetical protein